MGKQCELSDFDLSSTCQQFSGTLRFYTKLCLHQTVSFLVERCGFRKA